MLNPEMECTSMNIPELPKGYKERAENLICIIRDKSTLLWNIVREFGCDNIEMEGKGFKVTIHREPTAGEEKTE